MSESIVVIGATGHVGRRLVQRLAEDGQQVVGVAERLDAAERVPGVVYEEADLTSKDEAMRVLRNATAVFLTLPESGPDPLALERKVATNVIEAAKQHQTAHLVVATALHADRADTGVPLIDNKRAIERELVESGIPYTILRPGLFLETLIGRTPHARRDEIALPVAAGHPFGAVAADDVAKAAAAFLLGEPTNRAFDIHMPAGVRGEDIRRAESELLERPIGFKELKDDVETYLAGLDMPPGERALYADYMAYVRDNNYLGRPDEVERVLPDFRYSTLESFLHDEAFPRVRDFAYDADKPTRPWPGREAP